MKPFARLLLAAWLCCAAQAQAQAQDTLRAEVGGPLLAAQELLRAGKPTEALAKVGEAEAARDRTADENFFIERMRGSAAMAAGDDTTATRAFERVLASGRLPPAEAVQTLEVLAVSTYRARDYAGAASAAQRYFKDGGSSPKMRNLLVSAHYLSGDFAGVVRDLQGPAANTTALDEPTLKMLASSQFKTGDDAGYAVTLEKLLVLQPKPAYWADLLPRVEARPGFEPRLALDVYRLRMATGTMDDAAQYLEMARLASQAALPAEARKAVEAGFAAGKLGTGAEAARHQRLRETLAGQVRDDEKALAAGAGARGAEALVATGQALVGIGRVDQGIAMIEQGLAQGGLKRPDEARLRLAQAYLQGGRKDKAIETFQAVRGTDGSADLARLWVIVAR